MGAKVRCDGSINPAAVLLRRRDMPQAALVLWSPGDRHRPAWATRPEIILMKRAMLLAAAALTLTAFVPEQADAQVRRFGVRGPVVVGRGPVYAYPRGYYGYRRGY